jgi:hypothetical protein
MTVKKSTSSDKPYMSEYDKSVETRLQNLEEKFSDSSSDNIDEDRLSALEAKVNNLIERLSKKMSF